MSKHFPVDEPESIRVAVLDIESLSTRMRPVVTEVGYIVADLKRSDYTVWRENIVDQGTIQFDILEQVKMGRHIDPKTIQFQEDTFGPDRYREIVYGRPGHTSDFYYAADGLDKLRKALKGVHELWMNHPTFDAGRLNTLAEDCDDFGGLWYYGAEMDIHSIKYKHGLEIEEKDPDQHRGLADCRYNFSILAQFASTHTQMWQNNGRGYKWLDNFFSVQHGHPEYMEELVEELRHTERQEQEAQVKAAIGDHHFEKPAPRGVLKPREYSKDEKTATVTKSAAKKLKKLAQAVPQTVGFGTKGVIVKKKG
jgi:hypothetical protein